MPKAPTPCGVPRLPRAPASTSPSPLLRATPGSSRGSPFGLHYFVGGNTHMLRMLRHNVDSLDLSATEAQFDSTIARSLDMLAEPDPRSQPRRDRHARYWHHERGSRAPQPAPATNSRRAIPARRAWVELTMAADGDTACSTPELGTQPPGASTANCSVAWEPHHDVIVRRQPSPDL